MTEDKQTTLERLKATLASRRRAGALYVLLDYDGTLVPIADTPEAAVPDGALLGLLSRLADAPGVGVVLVSGRDRTTMDAWFGHLPLPMWAEHGFWYRPGHGGPWVPLGPDASLSLETLVPLLEGFRRATPGARVEAKDASVAWHYRGTPPDVAGLRVGQLLGALDRATAGGPLEVIEGKKVVEVRVAGVSKAAAARALQARGVPGEQILAIGDDRTDEEMFRALPLESITVSVGGALPSARFQLPAPADVRELLASCL